MKTSRLLIPLAVLSLLIAFNLFDIVPPISTSSVDFEFRIGDQPTRPYFLRVKLEKAMGNEVIYTPLSRVLVDLDGYTVLTNANGYAFFTTTPGKHVVSVISPTLPPYSVEVEITTRVTELVVTFVEYRLPFTGVNITVDTASQTSTVAVSYFAPPNSTLYVGDPYLSFIDFGSYLKRYNGESVIPYIAGAALQYRGRYTQITTYSEEESRLALAVVPDAVMVVLFDESFVPAFIVRNQLRIME